MSSAPLRKDVLQKTVLTYVLMLLYGVFTTIVGAVLTRLLADFSVRMSQGGIFYSMQSIGYFSGIVLSGFIIDRFDKFKLTTICFASLSLALIAINFAPSVGIYLCLILLAGLTAMLVDVLLNSSMAQLHTANRGFYMNLLHCCFGIGSFCGPMFAGYMLERHDSWRLTYLLLGIVCAAAACVYGILMRSGGEAAGGIKEPAPPFKFILRRRTLLAWLIMFFYISHQAGLNNWLPTYFAAELGIEPIAAGAGLSALWLGLIISRFCCSFLTRSVHEKTLIFLGCLLAGACFLVGVLVGGKVMLFTGSIAAGLFSGATIPMMLTLAYAWFPGAQGRVSMLLYAAISAGQIIFPWFMGKIGGVASLKVAMALNAAMLFVAAAITLALPKEHKRDEK